MSMPLYVYTIKDSGMVTGQELIFQSDLTYLQGDLEPNDKVVRYKLDAEGTINTTFIPDAPKGTKGAKK